MGIGSTTSTLTSGISIWIPTTPALAKAIRIVQRARRPSAYAREVFWPGSLGRQSRLSRSPQSLQRIERFHDGRQAAPLLLDPRSAQCPLTRSLTLRERATLTGRRRPRQRLLQLGAVWAPTAALPLVHSTRRSWPLLFITQTRSSGGPGHAAVLALLL